MLPTVCTYKVLKLQAVLWPYLSIHVIFAFRVYRESESAIHAKVVAFFQPSVVNFTHRMHENLFHVPL